MSHRAWASACAARCLSLIAGVSSFALSSSVGAVSIDWTPVGNAGNACETQDQGCFGAVGYEYAIGTTR